MSRKFRARSSHTIVILQEGGRASVQLEVPGWLAPTARSCAALALGFAFLLGFHLQALYGLTGPRMIELGSMGLGTERFCWFERMAPATQGPSRAEKERRIALRRAQALGLGTRRAAGLLLAGVIAPQWSDAADGGAPSDGSLLWPIRRGAFGRGYGSGQDGYHLAIDVEGERGDDVIASAPGIVGYAGRELSGYGNVIMIVHPGRRVTLYAHNQKNLVVAGERVYQGQTIAEVGSTGRSMGPHTHFEFKYDGKNCDPLPLVRAASSSVDRMPDVAALAWPTDAPRPLGLRCGLRRMHPESEEGEEPVVGETAPSSSTTSG